MGWNKNGSTVVADYLGQKVTGIVTESRVKYGGEVQHIVDLFFPITLFGSERTTVLLDASEVAFVEYESTTACEFDT